MIRLYLRAASAIRAPYHWPCLFPALAQAIGVEPVPAVIQHVEILYEFGQTNRAALPFPVLWYFLVLKASLPTCTLQSSSDVQFISSAKSFVSNKLMCCFPTCVPNDELLNQQVTCSHD